MKFNFDESNILAIYRKESREETIANIEEMMTFLEPNEVALNKLSKGVVEKLNSISDDEFNSLNYDDVFIAH